MSAAVAHRFQFRPLSEIASGKMFSSRWQKVVFIFTVWTTIGVLLYVPDLFSGIHVEHLIDKVVDAWSWALLTPAILFVDRKLSRFDRKPLKHAGMFLLFSAPFSLVHAGLVGVLLYPITEIWWSPFRMPSYLVFWFLGGWQICCAIIGTLVAFRYYRHYLAGQVQLERIEKRLLESHLNTLRMQLEPHFLFNALNAISSEVINNPELARDMIEDLGALLRLSLDYKDNQEIPLSQEIVLLEHYLAIQKVRFGDRIQTEISVSSDVMDVPVPCMLLQPIVENAIRHGLGRRISGGTVTVSAARVEEHVEIRIQDDGVGLPFGWRLDSPTGLGVRATRERLEGLYPEFTNHFEIKRRPTQGTEVIIRVPMQSAKAEDHGTAAA